MPHPDAYGDPDTIRVGDVVFVEGASALLGDVVSIEGPDEFGYTAAEVRWRRCYSTEDVEDLELARDARPLAPSQNLQEARDIILGVIRELGEGGPTEDLRAAYKLVNDVENKLLSYADPEEA